MSKTAGVIGATGLVGGHLLQALLQDPYFDTVVILVRRPISFTHPKLEKKMVDFSDGDSVLVALNGCDVLFCAIGTTNKQVKGDKAAYRRIDYDIPVNAARYAAMTGCRAFVLVSAVGANSSSGNFYLKLKGEVEDAVRTAPIPSIHFMRPSLLLGERKESRFGEKVGKVVMSAFNFLIPSKYKAIPAATVALAMIVAGKKAEAGAHVHEYREMITLSSLK